MAPVVKESAVVLTETSVSSHLKIHVAMANALFSPPPPSPATNQEKLVSSSTPPQMFSHSLTTVILKQAES